MAGCYTCCVRELTIFWQTITYIFCCKCCSKGKVDDEFDTTSVEYTVGNHNQQIYDNPNIEAELNIEMSALAAYQRSAANQNQIPVQSPPVAPPSDPNLDIANKTYMGIFMTELNQKWDHLAIEKQSRTNTIQRQNWNHLETERQSNTNNIQPLYQSDPTRLYPEVLQQMHQESYSDERTTRQAPYNFAYSESWRRY